jgi:hypothetical protein
MQEGVSQTDGRKEKSTWNFQHLFIAWVAGIVFQLLIIAPCCCYIGTATTLFTVVFDVVILLRIAIAYVLKEKGKGWILYCGLCYSSALWIEFGVSNLFERFLVL